MQEDIYIVGAGTYGEVMLELAGILGYKVKGFYDEKIEEISTVMGIKVIDKFSALNEQEIKGKNFIVAIGNNKIRFNLMNKINQIGGKTPSLIHPSAIISPSAQMGKGVYVQANVYIWTNVKIDDFCIISPGVVIAHHTTIGKACLISTLTGVGASINIEDKVFLGMKSTIVTGLHEIGENSIIGAGAVVLKDIEKESVYAGVPAKKIRNLN
ncbi:NeuD/PglB/VioB family sugar acetyltransferase [Pseudogracilibacillus auburnensis]|uniref:UDP-perosamine 4-acetyltransferase n=1 Tax=Pseudogracilibacillus auburnensis TaxID=1494959 RepID=A0A2V3VYH3_9BACI|nr:NeuD/PglB/VioB family sugar acetyltransferase [Pseudogracilibacillus auburnensis]PXW85951.1 UDP-perosamine 4-acetyltransferase [Pseudogracilibacillus auburnensis]